MSPNLKISRPLPLRDQVYNHLKELILSSKLQPGSPLVEEQLAIDLGVSRTPLREVIAILEGEGLVYKIPNRGTFVADISEADVRYIYEIRDVLERFAARRAALAVPLSDLQIVKTNFEQAADEIKNGQYDFYYRSHGTLHQLILRYADNPMLVPILDILKNHIQRIRAYASTMPERHVGEAYQEQRQLLDALLARDPDAAETAISKHLGNARKRVVAQLAEAKALAIQTK